VKLFFFKNTYDNVVTEEASFNLTWTELVELFSEHKISDTKEDVALFIAADFDTNPSTCRPATTKKHRQDGSLISETPITDLLGQPRAGRLSANVLGVHAIVLDYDGGARMTDAISAIEGITHLGYTSYSHMKDGATEKFRVIIPLNTVCPKAEWDLRKADVINLFPGTDVSTVNIARAFYIPSCPSNLKHEAFAWSIDAELFDWHLLNKSEPLPTPTPIDRSNLTSVGTGKVIYETFDMVQFFKDEGLYKRDVGGSKHDVHCPNIRHTDGGTVVWQDGSGWPSFHCSHHKCSGFNLFSHFKSKYGSGWMKPYCNRIKEESVESLALRFTPKKKTNKELSHA
jgi:hypothetical protein